MEGGVYAASAHEVPPPVKQECGWEILNLEAAGWITNLHCETALCAKHSRFEFPDPMSIKFSFDLESQDPRRNLPGKIVIGQNDLETSADVALKLLAFVLFYRERLQIDGRLHNDNIPFEPDLVQLDYELRPILWIECGECGVPKLRKLAVKVPEAEIWIVKSSAAEAEQLFRAMEKAELRRHRYNLLGLDPGIFDELCRLLQTRNELFWVSGRFDPPGMQFDFNGLWFDAPFTVLRF